VLTKEEADRFLLERKLDLRRVKPKEVRVVA
jgi:hypothetical protein